MSESVDGVEATLAENVRLSFMEEVGVGEDGQMRYRLTQAGIAHVEELLSSDPEMVALWAQLQALERDA